MRLQDLSDIWDQDSVIKRDQIDEELIKISKLHSKYLRLYFQAKQHYRAKESELKILRKEKHEFYTQGPTQEMIERGWKLPPCGKILKSEVSFYLDSDKELLDLYDKVQVAKDKVTFCEMVIDQIKQRSYNMKSLIDYTKFISGA